MYALRSLIALGGALLSTVLANGDATIISRRAIQPNPPNGHWIDTWTSMPQLTESANLPPAPFNQTGAVFVNSTIRQTLHMSVGASQIRLKISNAFGVTNLPITAVTIALPTNGSAGVPSIQTSTLQNVTFSGNASIEIPNGALAVSDPLDFCIEPQSMITVTMYLAIGQLTNSITSHPGSRTTSYWQFGNAVSAPSIAVTNSTTQSAAHWYFISAVEAWVPQSYSSILIIGDSITDGRGSDADKNNRWPDLLLARMQNESFTSRIGVGNQAAGGNRILADGLGPNALGRVERDVLSHPGVKYAMIFEGVNDIGSAPATPAAQDAIYNSLVQAYEQMTSRIHAFRIPVFAATITPFNAPANFTGSAYSSPIREVTRQRINAFIRDSGTFDAVVDFDKILADPAAPSQLSAQYNSGDYLHPNVAGYTRVAGMFPLGVFEEWEGGVAGFV